MTQSASNEVQVTKQGILIDLDVLLDTRLAALIATDPDWAFEYLQSGYRERQDDNWSRVNPDFDMKAYTELWESRDVELLSLSRLTNFMSHLLDIVKHYEFELAVHSDVVSEVFLIINTEPYQLDEQTEYKLVMAIKEYVGNVVEVKLVKENMNDLTIPYMVEKGYTQYVLYEFGKWCNLHLDHEGKLDKIKGKHDFAFIVPALVNKEFGEDTLTELKSHELEDEDPFELTRVVFAALMDLTFLPAEAFSLLDISKLEAGIPASSES